MEKRAFAGSRHTNAAIPRGKRQEVHGADEHNIAVDCKALRGGSSLSDDVNLDDSVHVYFSEISRVPLLTAAEEVSLAKRI